MDDQERRAAIPADALGAAWGDDPPITLTCGGSWRVPEAAICQQVEGVDWWAPEEASRDQSVTAVLTTVGWSPAVRVEVPAQHRPPAGVLVGVAPAIKQTLNQDVPCV